MRDRLDRRELFTAVAVFVLLLFGSPMAADAAASDSTVSPADRNLLVRVRQAGLWELPVGRQAMTRASSERVKEVGRHLADEHGVLDEEVREVAGKLSVELPGEPNPDQQKWMEEIGRQSGADYDRVMVNRLRAAHGAVLGVVAQVRAGTGNDVVRAFADHVMGIVLRHMSLLEGTGLVEPSALVVATSSSPPSVQAAGGGSVVGIDIVLGAAMVFLLIAGTCVVVHLLSSRNRDPR